MSLSTRRCLSLVLCISALAACGGDKPPPKTQDTAKDDAPRKDPGPGGPTIEQELGSIDQRGVEQTFGKLQAKLENCHKQGRDRVEYLAGDVKVFLRVGKDGKVKYSFFEESTLGDRDTEKCILEVFGGADWPKPIGGEAEVRNGFGWPAGSERQPTPWGPEKVTGALDEDKGVKKSIEKCKTGVSGDFRVTAYVEPGEPDAAQHGSGTGNGKSDGKGGAKGGGKKPGKKGNGKGGAAAKGDHGGRFKSIGIAPPGKDAADKSECVVDAIRGLSLPSPGSYAAKVTFTL